jgi:hypothetical protein
MFMLSSMATSFSILMTVKNFIYLSLVLKSAFFFVTYIKNPKRLRLFVISMPYFMFVAYN